MLGLLEKPVRKFFKIVKNRHNLDGFYKIRIVNRSKNAIWLAKNTVGDLHDIIPSGRSLEIRLPENQKMEFFAYKAPENVALTGLDYYEKKEFASEDIWTIY